MSEQVKMPALGESVTEGTVTRWLKQVGDHVAVDEPLLEVSTDKVDTEIPSPVAGTVLEIMVAEDETVAVDAVICVVGDASEAGAANQPAEAPAYTPEQAAVPPTPPATPAPSPAADQTPSTSTEVVMPALGESITEGTVVRWLKAIGDQVEMDEPLLEVSTDKVDSEVPAPVAGQLVEILAVEDETVAVGDPLCRLGEQVSAPAATAPAAPEPAAAAPPPPPVTPEEVPGGAIPSSVRQDDEGVVIEWAYPQAGAGYPGTMTPAGQVAPGATASVVAPPAPVAPVAPATPTGSAAPAAPASAQPATIEAAPARQHAPVGGYVTPLVRRLAREKDVDLTQIAGTGVGGRIRKEDVFEFVRQREEAARAAAAIPIISTAPTVSAEVSSLRGTTAPMSRLRRTIAKRMLDSLQVSAQLTTVVEVDMTRVAQLRTQTKDAFAARENTKLTFLPFFVKAATEALKVHPKVNATISGNEVTYHDREHIGIAVDTPRGLLVPVIKDAGDLTLAGIAKNLNDLAARTRASQVGPDELSGSTFTITNTGSGGALFDTPIINQPEVAILGVGMIVKRPAVIQDADGQDAIGIRHLVHLALSYDHRLVDGADAARYLMDVKKRLETADFGGELAS